MPTAFHKCEGIQYGQKDLLLWRGELGEDAPLAPRAGRCQVLVKSGKSFCEIWNELYLVPACLFIKNKKHHLFTTEAFNHNPQRI